MQFVLKADLRDSLMSSSSQEPGAPGKFAAMFSLWSEEPGNQFKRSVLKYADPSNLGSSLLEGNKDHLLSQARSELMKQEHQVESLNNCVSELQQQTCAQRLELQDAQHENVESLSGCFFELQKQVYAQRLELQDAHDGYIESRREQVRLQEELSMKEKVLRDTQIRGMHEMGEMRRELKNYKLKRSQCKN